MSIQRMMKRAMIKRMAEKPESRPYLVRNADENGYEVCHPRKGWRRVSEKRVRAQYRMAQLLNA